MQPVSFSKTYSREQVEALAQDLIQAFGKYKIWLFEGNVGAGKTTLIQILCKKMGIKHAVTSPTFALVNVYKNDSDTIRIYHMDLYRVKHFEELFEIGIEEYWYDDAYCFIEWPQLIQEFCPKPYVFLKLEHQSADKRSIFVTIEPEYM